MAASPNPRTLLLPDPEIIPSVLSGTFIPLLSACIGIVGVLGGKAAARLPLTSGIHKYIIAGGLGLYFGKLCQDYSDKYHMEKEAVLRHYIDLHPEDFPDPDRKKVGEVFSTWTPIR